MAVILHKLKQNLTIVLTLIWCLSVACTKTHERKLSHRDMDLVDRVIRIVERPYARDKYELVDGIVIRREPHLIMGRRRMKSRSNSTSIERLLNKADNFAKTHRIDISLSKLIPFGKSLSTARLGFGKNSFLTGFGLGFLAFGLKKLLLPIFIGAQIVKSILIAMFLPSILGSVGKLVGKGVTTFAQSSGSSNFGAAGTDTINDFDFKDTGAAQTNVNPDSDPAGSESAYNSVWAYPTASANNILSHGYQGINYLQQPGLNAFGSGSPSLFGNTAYDHAGVHTRPATYNRFNQKPKDSVNNKYYSGSFYSKDKTEDFKVFHNIPTSSHLLANYDPFYSPLLSRIDSVFKQLGYTAEPCRERLVCNMYKNPAKYAPFSNLVSAQLSRELNELRKPASDNPEILRFFRYMKAAKDGQDGQECDIVYSECTTTRASSENAPMVSTYNDINKLVQARSI